MLTIMILRRYLIKKSFKSIKNVTFQAASAVVLNPWAAKHCVLVKLCVVVSEIRSFEFENLKQGFFMGVILPYIEWH